MRKVRKDNAVGCRRPEGWQYLLDMSGCQEGKLLWSYEMKCCCWMPRVWLLGVELIKNVRYLNLSCNEMAAGTVPSPNTCPDVQLMTPLPEPPREPKEQDRDSSKGCFSKRNKNLRSSWNILFGNTFCIDCMMPHLHIQYIIYISNTFVYSIPFLHFWVVKYLISLFSWQIGSSFTK